MAITAPIPMPDDSGDAFLKGAAGSQSIINSIMQNKLVPYQQQELAGNAAKSQMIANLINRALGGAESGSGNASVGGGVNGGSSGGGMNFGAFASGILGLPVQTNVVDGKIVQTNPITGTSEMQVGQTPQEKSDLATKQSTASAQGSSDVSLAKDLETQAQDAREMNNYLKSMDKLLIDNPDLTGPIAGRIGPYMNNKDLGKFQYLAGLMQTKLAKSASQRGGIGIINWTKGVKPDATNRVDFNRGIISEGVNQLANNYKDLDDRYFKIKGEHLPNLSAMQEQTGVGAKESSGGAGEERLAKNLTIPSFATKQEFQSWYNRQPEITKRAIKLKIREQS